MILSNEIKEYCAKHMQYACPREFEFRDELPNISWKNSYRILEQEEEEKNAEYVAMRSELKTETKKSAKKTKKKGM